MLAMFSRSRVNEFAIEGFRLIREKTEERKKVRATFAFARIVARGSRAACPVFFLACLLLSTREREHDSSAAELQGQEGLAMAGALQRHGAPG